MKILQEIVRNLETDSVIGSLEVVVHALHFDSRQISQNDAFFAIRGTLSDGHNYIEKAISLGATTIVCDTMPQITAANCTYIVVKDTNAALAVMAANFYEHPSAKLQLVGVTGTNGKTTIASLLYQLYKKAGYKVGLLSTVKIMVDTEEYKATHTTPDSITINSYLKAMVSAGVTYCFMEVSSHGIHQKRTNSLHFVGGIFTNLSHDHLDYHATFAEYRDVKKAFFDSLPKTAFALSNIDDKNGLVMLQNTSASKRTYALKSHADYKAQVLENQLSGLLLKINNNEVWTKLIGTFNAYNLLAIYATAIELGMEALEALRLVSELESVSGRFQYFVSATNITVIVDYAHTPDALENVLKTINDIRSKNEQLLTVVGCGGNRDAAKRPLMAGIASNLSDKVIFTSDNPRNENPEDIIAEMEQGVAIHQQKKVLSITDRKQAIKTACQLAQQNDIILIAGKGHENYQEVLGIRHPFDDLETVKDILLQLEK